MKKLLFLGLLFFVSNCYGADKYKIITSTKTIGYQIKGSQAYTISPDSATASSVFISSYAVTVVPTITVGATVQHALTCDTSENTTAIASGNYLNDVKVSSAIYSTNSGNADTVDTYHLNQNVLTTSTPTFGGAIINGGKLDVFGNVSISTGSKYYLDNSSNTYLTVETGAKVIKVYAGGMDTAEFSATAVNFNGNISLVPTKTLYLDSGVNTGITEGSSDRIDFIAGGITAMDLRPTVSYWNVNLNPAGAGTHSSGDGTDYWANVQTHDLTKSGGGTFGCFDNGVELQDGKIVSDTESLLQWTAHKDRKTKYGIPALDYKKMPKVVFVKSPLPRNNDDIPYEKKDGNIILRPDTDGESVFPVISIMIGAIKELALQNKELIKRIEKLEMENIK